ncbi:Rho GTPase activation protein [Chytridium lagenaria]|nr:Rho GTPase activation protein [Chytridium lagenaria]
MLAKNFANATLNDPTSSTMKRRNSNLPTSSSEGSLSLYSNPDDQLPKRASTGYFSGPPVTAPAVEKGVNGWVEGVQAALNTGEEKTEVVEGIDEEGVVQMLCDFESGFAMLLERIKANMHSTKEVVQFLKKRSQIEDEYGRSMIKLSQSVLNQKPDGKEGSFNESWRQFVKVHEQVGDIRIKFGESISEVAEELSTLFKTLNALKDAGYKHWKAVHDSEVALEKAKTKYESLSEDWEKAILNRELQMASDITTGVNGPMTPAIGALKKTGLPKSLSSMQLWKQGTSNPGKLQKMEDDARMRASVANENYKQQLLATNGLRTAYFQSHLPRFIRLLKETNDSCDAGTKQHLARHAREMEESLVKEATTLSPVDKDQQDMSIINIVERIDNPRDFYEFMQDYFQNQKQLQKSEYQYSPYAMKSAEAVSIANAKPVFGMNLTLVFERDGQQVPAVITRCIQAIENFGLSYQGVYRVSGTTTQIQRLRTLLDRDAEKVNMEDWAESVPTITGVLKLYFRELPDPLLPKNLYHSFIDAAKIEDERMRLIAIHELVNQLHDSHYSTLQVLMAHLWKVQQYEQDNKMTTQNLSIVWGPTLMDSPDVNPDPTEIKHQSRVVETILCNFERIFEPDE